MKNIVVRCLYSCASRFETGRVYMFEEINHNASFSLYHFAGYFGMRHTESNCIVMECDEFIIAVFEALEKGE